MRVKGWEKRLTAMIGKHQRLPSEYGVSDCYLIVDDAVEAVTGECIDPTWRKYKTEAGAAKLMRKHGFENVEQVLASKFEAIPTMQAQRGDIGVMFSGGQLCGGVFTALGFMTRNATSVAFVPVTYVKTAFKVGR